MNRFRLSSLADYWRCRILNVMCDATSDGFALKLQSQVQAEKARQEELENRLRLLLADVKRLTDESATLAKHRIGEVAPRAKLLCLKTCWRVF